MNAHQLLDQYIFNVRASQVSDDFEDDGLMLAVENELGITRNSHKFFHQEFLSFVKGIEDSGRIFTPDINNKVNEALITLAAKKYWKHNETIR